MAKSGVVAGATSVTNARTIGMLIGFVVVLAVVGALLGANPIDSLAQKIRGFMPSQSA